MTMSSHFLRTVCRQCLIDSLHGSHLQCPFNVSDDCLRQVVGYELELKHMLPWPQHQTAGCASTLECAKNVFTEYFAGSV